MILNKELDNYPISDYIENIRNRIKEEGKEEIKEEEEKEEIKGEEMKEKMTMALTVFNQIYKEMDLIYHNYAKAFGLSDSTFWILYILCEYGEACSQRELCEEWSFSPQTVNSSLKSLEKQGLITLEFAKGNRKSKEINFTEEGRVLARKVIEPMIQAENKALSELSQKEQEAVLTILQKHVSLLGNEIDNTLQQMQCKSSED